MEKQGESTYTYCFDLWHLMLRGLNPRTDRARVSLEKLNYTADGLAAEIKDKDGQVYRVTIKPKGNANV